AARNREEERTDGLVPDAVARGPHPNERLGRHIVGSRGVPRERQDEAADGRRMFAIEAVEVQHAFVDLYPRRARWLQGFGFWERYTRTTTPRAGLPVARERAWAYRATWRRYVSSDTR